MLVVIAVTFAVLSFPALHTRGFLGWIGAEGNFNYTMYQDQGFAHGHLYMNLVPDPTVLNAKDPWDPAQTGAKRINDVAYYQGHYYYAWGPMPALVFLPFVAATTILPSEGWIAMAILALCVWPLALLLALLRDPKRVPWEAPTRADSWWSTVIIAAPPIIWGAGIAQIYQFSQAWGFLGLLVALWAAFAITATREKSRKELFWLGIACGLGALFAFGSRFSLLAPVAVLFVYLALHALRTRAWRVLLPAAGVAGGGLALICIYNYARFDSFLETGWQYQMGSLKQIGLAGPRLQYLKGNTPVFGWAYPEIRPSHLFKMEAFEPTFGFLWYLGPALLLALIVLAWDRLPSRWELGALACMVVAGLVAFAFTASATYDNNFRYVFDFLPLFAIPALVLLRSRPWLALIGFAPSLLTSAVLYGRWPY